MKKNIIIGLIFLIICSLGLIVYLAVFQNSNLKVGNLNLFKKENKLTVPSAFFPEGTRIADVFTQEQKNDSGELGENNGSFGQNNLNRSDIKISNLSLSKIGNEEKVFFVDRSFGNLYEIDKQNNLIRLTNETINNIENFYFVDGKTERVLIQTANLNRLNTLKGEIKRTATGTDLGYFDKQNLGLNILAITLSPNKESFFTLESSVNGVDGYLNDWTGKNKKRIWSFPFSDWVISWPTNNIIGLQTKPSTEDLGYLYFLNPQTSSLTKILSGIPGLSTKISPDGQRVIFSRDNLGRLETYLYDLSSKETGLLGLNTLPEKCFWFDNKTLYCAVPRNIPTGKYPDNWYQGKITFVDDVWKIDTSQKTVSLIISLKGSYDLVNLIAVPDRGWLYAINKTDNSLQSFSLLNN